MKVTLQDLQTHGACLGQQQRFQRAFPNGAKVNLTNARKAVKSRLILSWVAEHLLTPAAYKRWDKATDKAHAACEKAKNAAERAYDKAVNPARRKWMRAKTDVASEKAYNAYGKINSKAATLQDRAKKAAVRAYDEACARALVEAVKWMEANK